MCKCECKCVEEEYSIGYQIGSIGFVLCFAFALFKYLNTGLILFPFLVVMNGFFFMFWCIALESVFKKKEKENGKV